jgi:hypothetical protein
MIENLDENDTKALLDTMTRLIYLLVAIASRKEEKEQ